ncbi:pimeloyl-ACP methyl ester carboxylesterase [Paenibacillus taihuensis]|uniref:Pimeloyl-ACP methyl ester carboxylesterase n=1 Tax=Paenibacillus taihuensis TaxID=1156355 RepID=A0A3D9SQE6_9BACL|nr:alpha/beta hydrolase [Paenibacillus taihuensis]REE92911.1 pimeloyl-ACP methyl ester carboxylesterase [Paenibacillus taihuensis]
MTVHPPGLSSQLFVPLEEKLTGDSELIRFDIRGHGSSSAGDGNLSLALIAEDMRLLLDELGEETTYLCSYGSGSFPLLTALLAYPERFKGGILINGTAGYTDFASHARLQATFVSSVLAPKDPIAYKSAQSEAGNRAEFQSLYADVLQGDSAKWREYTTACLGSPLKKRLSQIRQPMLIMYGAEDRVSLRYASELKRLPNREYYAIEGASKQLLTRHPETIAFIMSQWIDKQEHPELADTFEERSALLEELVTHGAAEGHPEDYHSLQ